MQKNIFIAVLMALTAPFTLVAQNVQGKAYYISNSKVNIDFGGRQISEAQKARIKERQNKLSTKNYVLEFNQDSSLFSEIITMNQNVGQTDTRGGGIRILLGNQESGTYYKNVITKEFVGQRDIFGKQFLIEDSLQNYDWQFSDEVQLIGKYTCFKATATIPISTNIPQDPDKRTSTVTVWYTIEIPVSHGPEMFWGLPGLILKLKTENRVLLCSKIELGTAEEINIIPPKKGKKVSQEKFDEILAKKTGEVKELYKNRKTGAGRRNG